MSLSFQLGSYLTQGKGSVPAIIVKGVRGDTGLLAGLRLSIRELEVHLPVSVCIEQQPTLDVFVTVCAKHQISNQMADRHLRALLDDLEESYEEKV